MAKEANCAFFAVGDEADGLAVERLQTVEQLHPGRQLFRYLDPEHEMS